MYGVELFKQSHSSNACTLPVNYLIKVTCDKCLCKFLVYCMQFLGLTKDITSKVKLIMIIKLTGIDY